MDPITLGLLLGGAGLGVGKSYEEQQAAKRQRKLQAAFARNSPWTGVQAHPENIHDPSYLGNISQGLLAGGMLAQGMPSGGSAGAMGTNATPGGWAGMDTGTNATPGGWAGMDTGMNAQGMYPNYNPWMAQQMGARGVA